MDKLLLIRQAFNLLFEDTDSDEDSFSDKADEKDGYVDDVPKFSDTEFKEHFRMSPDVFEILCCDLHAISTVGQYGPGRDPISIEKQLMITLWYLGSQEPMRLIGKRFEVSIASVWKIIAANCNAILKINKLKKYIKWPTAEEAAETANYYSNTHGFRGVVGSIHGVDVLIRTPIHCHKSYINRNGVHSILLQGICNHKMEFLFCYTGEVGSITNDLLMERSGLEHKINLDYFHVDKDHHLVGDSSYPLQLWLIPPYTDDGTLGDEQKIFNSIHAQCAGTIKKALQLLIGRFRRLCYIDCLKPESIVKYIIAACILHNICLRNNDMGSGYLQLDDADDTESELCDDCNPIPAAATKRDNLLNTFFY